MQQGQKFDLEDFRDQLQQMANMGGLSSMLVILPGRGNCHQRPGAIRRRPIEAYGRHYRLYDCT